MKKLLTPVLVILLAFTIYAQDEQSMQDAQAESMKAWQEYMTPGEEHAMLAKGAGEWKVTQTFWMAPGAEPMTTEGTASAEMIMGGRYLVTKHGGNVMGMPFEGMSLEGYDNAAEKYVNVWIDNLGTGVAYAEGHYDEKSGMIVYEGTMTSPETKEAVWFKQTIKHIDDSKVDFAMYMKSPDGSEFKNMEVILTKSEM